MNRQPSVPNRPLLKVGTSIPRVGRQLIASAVAVAFVGCADARGVPTQAVSVAVGVNTAKQPEVVAADTSLTLRGGGVTVQLREITDLIVTDGETAANKSSLAEALARVSAESKGVTPDIGVL